MKKNLLLAFQFTVMAQLAFAEGRLRLAKQPGVQEEGGTLTRYSVQTERREFHFLPPPDWQVTLDDAAQAVVFAPRDGSVRFSLKITWSAGAKPALPDLAALRSQLLERHPDTIITEEFTAHASQESGPAFDLTYTTAKTYSLASRVAFIPFPGGMVEFELTARPEKFAQNHLTFGRLLNSFQIEEAGPPVARRAPSAAVALDFQTRPAAAK